MKHLLKVMLLALFTALAAVPAGAAEKITVMLDWFVNPDHGPLFVAQERGEFAVSYTHLTLPTIYSV